jgi:hypothetical protein
MSSGWRRVGTDNFFWAMFRFKRRSGTQDAQQRFKNAVNDSIGIEPAES